MQFVPLWTSILRSRKVASLPDDLYRTWTYCLCAAQEYDHRGGALPMPDDLSYALHMDTHELLSRLSRLSRLGFVEERDGVWAVHDWEDWKHRPDPTAAARKRAERDRKRMKGKEVESKDGGADASDDVTVTAVTSKMSQCHAPTQLNSPTPTPHTPLPPVTGGAAGEGECEPFESPGEPTPNPAAPPMTAEARRVLDRATERWGASNGDRIVADLLKDFAPAVVGAACDQHYARAKGVLQPERLLGICQAMHSGKWQLPAKGAAIDTRAGPGQTNQPGGPTPEQAAKIDAELAVKPRMTRAQWEAQQRERDRAKGA